MADAKTCRVVVIEDDDLTRSAYIRILQSVDRLEVEAFSDGAGGLKRILEDPPALVITDLYHPAPLGIEIIERIRAKPRLRSMQVWVISGKASTLAGAQALEAGANEYVMKPFTKEIIADKLRALNLVS